MVEVALEVVEYLEMEAVVPSAEVVAFLACWKII
jgi:hypothetical protein